MKPSGAVVKTGVAWLGLSTLGCFVLLLVELLDRAPYAAGAPAVLYLLALSALCSALGSVFVGAVHLLALRLAGPRARVALGVWAVLGVSALPFVVGMSAELTAGGWISQQPHVQWWRALFALVIVVLLQLLWLWHAYGVSGELRAWVQQRSRLARRGMWFIDAVFVLVGVLVLCAVFVAVPGVLRPYEHLAAKLSFPTWLVSATLAFSLLRVHARAAARSAAAVLLGGTVAVGLYFIGDLTLARGRALEARGLADFADALVNPKDETLLRLDFSAVRGAADLACPKPRKPPALSLGKEQRRNVILLSIDAMRADALGMRLRKRVVAPHIEAFERESVSFTRATAAAPITLLSLTSALTGRTLNQLWWQRQPPQNVFEVTRSRLTAQHVFLPKWDIFAGYAFKKMLTSGTPRHLHRESDDPAGKFIAAIEAAQVKRERGLFWLHLPSPHKPYTARKDHDFGRSARARYYGEVAYVDTVVGRVLDDLRESGRFEDSLIAVFSDHGEALGERGGYYGHGVDVVGRFMDVPLLVRYPGVTPQRVAAPVVLTQLAPTIYHYLDMTPPAGVAACSLLAPAEPGCLPAVSMVFGVPTANFVTAIKRPVRTVEQAERRQDQLLEWRAVRPLVFAVTSEHRYVRNLETGVEHLYRRPDPSSERDDIAAEEPAVVEALRGEVAAFRRADAQRIACELDDRAR